VHTIWKHVVFNIHAQVDLHAGLPADRLAGSTKTACAITLPLQPLFLSIGLFLQASMVGPYTAMLQSEDGVPSVSTLDAGLPMTTAGLDIPEMLLQVCGINRTYNSSSSLVSAAGGRRRPFT
jgi:hypothetical protein